MKKILFGGIAVILVIFALTFVFNLDREAKSKSEIETEWKKIENEWNQKSEDQKLKVKELIIRLREEFKHNN